MIPAPQGLLDQFAAAREASVVSFRQHDSEPTGDGFIVGYSVELRTADGAEEHADVYLNTASRAAADERSLVLTGADGSRVVAWQYPHDPSLPALSAVSFPEAVGHVLEKFGIRAHGASVTLEAYRPGKRAVFRVDAESGRYFIKVVDPASVSAIHGMHGMFLARGVRVPHSLGYADSGMLLLDRLPGDSAAARIADIGGDPRFLSSLDALTLHMAQVPLTGYARASLAKRADWYSSRMRQIAPAFADRTQVLTQAIARIYGDAKQEALVAIHGDMHLGQIFVEPAEPWRIIGVLDIDTAGMGDPADDRGALYGHICVSSLEAAAAGRADAGTAFWQMATTLRAGFSDWRVRSIAATHLVGHALATASKQTESGDGVTVRLLDEADSLLRAH
ncbi:aminoglycoside phosphotransferase family protein [Agrococcus casei]|uniref:aminoglycoside phosphotransferase family protein n=1 Tax=Agrococcus casei TaxID=343512 RepID=UPI003F9923CA